MSLKYTKLQIENFKNNSRQRPVLALNMYPNVAIMLNNEYNCP